MPRKNNYIDLGSRGKFNRDNKLNDLTGKEWIKFSKSWFIHRPARRNLTEVLHPAKYPETMIEEFISFFTKKNGNKAKNVYVANDVTLLTRETFRLTNMGRKPMIT